jgi:hypothetical protein
MRLLLQLSRYCAAQSTIAPGRAKINATFDNPPFSRLCDGIYAAAGNPE